MSKVELRLAQLREAAELLRRSSSRIDLSVQNVQAILDQLYLLGCNDPTTNKFALECGQQRAWMDSWSQQLLLFSTKLAEAVTDLEQAIYNHGGGYDPNPLMAYSSNTGAPRYRTRFAPLLPLVVEKPEPAPLPFELEDFVAEVNRPLYSELVQQQNLLGTHQTHLEDLLQDRRETLGDLVALKNRLISFDGHLNLGTHPRVQMLEAEIARLDQEILTTQEKITGLQDEITRLAERLDRVKPGLGADLRLVANLQNSETSEWIKDHTYGCVNYIVNRMPIPAGIPRHAYLWDQAATQLTQYGISSGNVPLVGSVIVLEQTHAYADDVFGHLMYVERIEDGVVWVTDNLHPDVPVRLSELTEELTGPNLTYLYFPWHTQA